MKSYNHKGKISNERILESDRVFFRIKGRTPKHESIVLPVEFSSSIPPTKLETFDIENVDDEKRTLMKWNLGTCEFEYTHAKNGDFFLNDIKVPSLSSSRKKSLTTGHLRTPLGSERYFNEMTDLLMLLEVFSDFAELNNITYTHRNGNLLGWCRDGTLLPWDDDIDLLVKEDDFETLEGLFDLDDAHYFDDEITWFMSPEGYKGFGPKVIPYGTNREIIIVLFKDIKYIQIFDRKSFHFQKGSRKTYKMKGVHLDIETCFWTPNYHYDYQYKGYEYDKDTCRKIFFGYYKGPRPEETPKDYPLQDFCGVKSRFPKDCESWLNRYFQKGNWEEKVHPSFVHGQGKRRGSKVFLKYDERHNIVLKSDSPFTHY